MSLQTITETLLDEKSGFKETFESVHQLHHYFASLSGIHARNDLSTTFQEATTDIYLPSGKAISAQKAAHCLLEFQRTTMFLRGIYKAIKELKQRFPGQKLNILYAGCGPYATLLTPFTSLFSPSELNFYLLDINAVSLQAVKQLYNAAQLDEYVADYILADATMYHMPDEVVFHLVISETMLNALRKEPQVEIIRNIIPQMHQQAIFIPQEIKVSAWLLDAAQETASFIASEEPVVPQRIFLADIFTISKEQFSGQPPVIVTLPDQPMPSRNLSLMTDIRVYDSFQLSAYESSLNMPVKVMDIASFGRRKVEFKYITGATPGFQHEILEVASSL